MTKFVRFAFIEGGILDGSPSRGRAVITDRREGLLDVDRIVEVVESCLGREFSRVTYLITPGCPDVASVTVEADLGTLLVTLNSRGM